MIKWIIIGVLVLILLFFAVTYNSLIQLKNSVEEAFATMDVYLKKRFDLVPNLIETVKGYASHEAATLEKVVQARMVVSNSSSMEEKLQGENALSGTLRNLFALSESYPDLKANASFIDLQSQLKSIEEDIANSRKYYNAVVRDFNNKVEMFPSNLIAGMCHFKKKPMFEVSDAVERENIHVKF